MSRRLDLLYLLFAAVLMVVSILLGVWVGVFQTFEWLPVHAYLAAMGWSSLALYGVAYRAFPELADARFKLVQLLLSGTGAVLVPLGLFLELSQGAGRLILVAVPLWALGALLFLSAVLAAVSARGSPRRIGTHRAGNARTGRRSRGQGGGDAPTATRRPEGLFDPPAAWDRPGKGSSRRPEP